MGFQVNGVEYINSSGDFTNGLKTANSQAMTGSGAITTGQASTFGTNFDVVGSMTIGFAWDNTTNFAKTYTASGNYGFANTVTLNGCEVGTTIAGSEVRNYTGATLGSYTYYSFTTSGAYTTHGFIGTGHSGTWRALDNSSFNSSYTAYATSQLFIRIL